MVARPGPVGSLIPVGVDVSKKIIPALSVFAVAGLVAACGTPGGEGATDSAASGGGPIKVALIPPASGALAQFGSDAVQKRGSSPPTRSTPGWRRQRPEGRADQVMDTDAHPRHDVARSAGGRHAEGRQVHRRGHDLARARRAERSSSRASASSRSTVSARTTRSPARTASPNAFRVVQSTTMDINALAASHRRAAG